MAVNVEDGIARLDPERRRKVEERDAELVAEETTLREAVGATGAGGAPL